MTMISIPEHSPVAVEPTMKSSRSIWKWMTLALTLVAMIIVLAKALPFLHVDRVYENAYMGCPYRLLASHHPRIVNDDPFVENGPHGVYPATAIVYYSGSMAAMRWYNFLFSLIMMALFVLFFFQEHPDSGNSPWEATAYGLLMLTIWKIIGLTLIYPIQVTGMMPGFDCFLLGLWLNRRHPYAAMIAFGFAYSFKGQFLAMLAKAGLQ